ncbi:MAG: BON domain-containing protein [Acidobacteria bacterium]|nr:BON domain-containing protein [Acidobacteriota bacterium]MBV9144899.1 BON domain-containing protein [Acidobacteriota bacterium]MBV9436650.1 BON domain-containing protein [Acidobacteriota bacterium]
MRLTRVLAFVAVLLAVFSVACSQQKAQSPDVTDQIKDSLKTNNLGDVKVSEDRDKGVITLSGDVKTDQDKAQAEDLAKQNAGGLIIANEIGVRPEGAEGDAKKVDKNLDKGIEDNYRAALTEKGMDNQHIHFNSKNGVMTLTGDVDTPTQREQAEKMAAAVPNVSQVVNELQVKGAKKARRRAAQAGE